LSEGSRYSLQQAKHVLGKQFWLDEPVNDDGGFPNDTARVIDPSAFGWWHDRNNATDAGNQPGGLQNPFSLVAEFRVVTVFVGDIQSQNLTS